MAVEEWTEKDGFLNKEYKLKDFEAALAFVNKVGKIAEEMDHHPDICIHSYNRVSLKTKTHSEGKITEKDFKLAEKVNQIQ